MSTPEEILTATKSQIVSLINKLPIEKLQPLRDYLLHEAKKLEPAIMEAESRLKTIIDHLVGSMQREEYVVINSVHEFLVARGKIVPFTPPPADAASAAENVQAVTAAPEPSVQA